MEKRQKIRGLALGLLCAAFALSGCERSEEEPLALLTLDKERIVFDNPAEGETAQAVLRIEADRRWSVGFIGNGHDCRVSVLSGEAGVHELRIETSETNTGRDLHRLGQLTVALDDGSANRTVDLQQRPQAARQTLLMYFCGTDLYSYYKNNLSDVAKALSRNILPLGRIVAFTQPAAGEGYVVEYRYDEAANACERDTLIRYTPLPGRTTVVLTRQALDIPGCTVVHSLEEAVALFPDDEEVFVIGGAQVYAEALPLAGRFYLTRVRHPYEGDTRFPAWDESEWRLAASEAFPCGASYPWPFVFETWERR